MSKFQVFDTVKLNEEVTLPEEGTAPAGTRGVIVEVLGEGEAYLVELFGAWVELDEQGMMVPSAEAFPAAFQETIGVATAQANQLTLVKAAAETMGARGRLLTVLEELPETSVQEVADFAEFLRHKQRRKPVAQ
jgi:hypothetical protein